VQVELRPHVAEDGTEFDQNLVMVDGRQVGWMGNREDSCLVLLPNCHVPKKDRQALKDLVSQMRQRPVMLSSPPDLPKAADLKNAIDD
jgi:hypothetical protein